MQGSYAYETDVLAWSRQQAKLLRAGRFAELDIEHLAEEIEDVGKSEQRELANRMALLLAHLLKWAYQPERRGTSWRLTIRNQRRGIQRCLEDTPSLRGRLGESRWWEGVWEDAAARAAQETGLADFPETCPWDPAMILDETWLP